MLLEVDRRYERPMIIAETGSEGDERAPWLRYVAGQSDAALRRDCELHGVTLYPMVNHPGWVDERHCHNGLWDYPHQRGDRTTNATLFDELQRQKGRLHAARDAMLARCESAAHGSRAVGRWSASVGVRRPRGGVFRPSSGWALPPRTGPPNRKHQR